MALDPIVSGTLNQMLGGNSFVEQRDPFEIDTGMLGEIPMWRNPRTDKMEPVDGYPGPVHGPVPFPKYDRSIFGGNDSNTPVPFPKYDRNIFGGDDSNKPVPFPAPAPGFSPIGTYDPNNPSKAEPIGTYDPNKPSFPVQLPYPAKQEEVAMEDWRKPYVKKWIRHHNTSDPFLIKDKDYLKDLQGIVLFNRPI